MKRISLLLMAVIGCQAADPNTSPWPASGPSGIGTTSPLSISPSAILMLNKSTGHNYMLISTELASQSAISFSDNTNGQDGLIYRPSGSRDLRVYVAAVGDVMSFMQNGNVGIGTTTPAAKTQIVQSIGGNDSLYVSNAVSNNVSRLTAAAGFNNFLDWYSGTGAGALIFRNAGVEQMRIDSSGNVGIGTVPLGAKLQINGRLSAGDNFTTGGSVILADNYSGPEHLTTFGTSYSYGGPVIGYGVTPSTVAPDAFISSVSIPGLSRAALTLTGNSAKFWFGPGQTSASGSAVTISKVAEITNAGDILCNGGINAAGSVVIGSFAVTPTSKLAVNGTISAKEIKVTTNGADYVFENDYKLRSLAEVEQFIAAHRHLPEMMSAKAMQADGMPVSEVVTKQLAKIEELTLYAIKSDRERQAQADRLAALEKQVADMAAVNAQLATSVHALLAHSEQAAAKK